jgi:single-stranded-DNA-specific exonuclease
MHDPLLMQDIETAARLIQEAVEGNAFICVFGDYDCDGVTATVMVTHYLERLARAAAITYPTGKAKATA